MELAVLTWLMVKHVVADYFLQTSWMIQEKADYGKLGGIFHAGEHGILTAVTLWFFGVGWWIILFALIDCILHYHIDWCKSNYLRGNFRFAPWPYDSEDPQYWWAMGIDQFLHYMTYVLIIILIGAFGVIG